MNCKKHFKDLKNVGNYGLDDKNKLPDEILDGIKSETFYVTTTNDGWVIRHGDI